MKIFLLILCLLCSVVTSHSAPKPSPAPELTEADREKITQQRDLLLEQLVAKLVDAKGQLATAQTLHVQDGLTQAKLQTTTDGMETTIQNDAVKITALEKSVIFWKRIVAIEAACVALFLCLWLKLPELSPPWGLVATVLIAPLVFGLMMLL